MNTTLTIAVFSLLAIAACSSPNFGDELSASESQQRILPSDNEILSSVYDVTYQAPDNFYVDERVSTTRSYTLYHVKDSSISYELCTNDYQQALAWETADNENRSVNGYYVDSYENDRYFEFIRELSFPDGIGNIGDLTSPGFARVFKCSYVNRDGVDRNLRDGYAGTLNFRPLTRESLQIYSEYMWQFTFFWPAEKKVLQSFSSENSNSFDHTLVLAFKTNRGYEQCDLIEVVDWIFSVDKESGNLTKEFNLLFVLEAELIDGVPTKCG